MSAGYSGTPLPKKLGIEAGARVAVIGDPGHAEDLLSAVPAGVRIVRDPPIPDVAAPDSEDAFDVVLCFLPRLADLEERFAAGARLISWSGGLWACWPKKQSSLYEDLTASDVRAHGLDAGLVDNKVCAVDGDWSGLRFVYRVVDRPR